MKCRNCKNITIKEEDEEQYKWCEEVLDNPDVDMERDCKHFKAARNVDTFRSMTDEEIEIALGKEICVLVGSAEENEFGEWNYTDMRRDCCGDCLTCLHNWLMQYVKDGN